MTPERADGPGPTARTRLPAWIALAAALFVGAHLAAIVVGTRWAMDADEAVHAVEALRLHDDLAAGDVGGFLADTYFPERWAPPVNPHVRWYPFAHAWLLQPFFALLGPSDVSARLPSVLCLLATCAVFSTLARRLAPEHPEASGLVAVLAVLGAPNLLTFSAQSLIDGSAVLTAFLALLAYLRSLEAGHPVGRALVAALALTAATLTKYDHGGVLAVSLALAELVRARLSPARLWRGGALRVFAPAGLLVAAWFAHPDKLAALGDSLAHPFYGSPRSNLLDFLLTWPVEYATGFAGGAILLVSFLVFARRLSDPAARAVWIWAAVSTVFYAARGRFHFRYNLVEAPIFGLLAAVVLPDLVTRFAALLARGGARRVRLGIALGALGIAGLAAGAWAARDPAACVERLGAPLGALLRLRADRFGLRQPLEEHLAAFARDYGAFVVWAARSGAAASLGVLVAGGLLASRWIPRSGRAAAAAGWAVVVVAVAPGAVELHAGLRERVEWELEGHPELLDLHDFVRESAPPGTTVLLAGGWDQFPNNALRWYRATRDPERPPLAEVDVVGDMIGSVVFPPEPRIRSWAQRLARAPWDELPDVLVLLEPQPDFLYATGMGPEVAVYEAVVERRGGWTERARRAFPALGLEARALARGDAPAPPVELPSGLLERHGLGPGGEARRDVAPEGWRMRDESLRHFVAR